jgi:WS/DGAT/MGAT family acyltransferase
MAGAAYEPLSAQDNAFLKWEGPNLPMHTSALQIFETGPLARSEAGVDFEAIRNHISSALHEMPRYRQKLRWIPGEERAVWVDDPEFRIQDHVRHEALPHPGSHDQLLALTGRLIEQPLDRGRPLWEMHVIEGLAGGRFAIVSKLHHCLMDGRAGAQVMTRLLSRDPDPQGSQSELARPVYHPRPEPTPDELRRDARWERLMAPLRAVGSAIDFAREHEDVGEVLRDRAGTLRDLLGWYVAPVSETPINGPVGPHRRFATLETPLELLLEIRRARSCTVNDVVLAVVAGALREFLIACHVRPEQLDFRASTPVDVRGVGEAEDYGNRVSSWIVPLPIGESDPLARLEAISSETRARKRSHQSDAIAALTAWMDWLPVDLQQAAARASNCVITNVRGPGFPLYLLGARQLAVHPQPPLMANQGLAIGVLSYDGRLCWGLNADADRIPDLGDLVDALARSIDALAADAGVKAQGAARTPEPARRAEPARTPEPAASPAWPDTSRAPRSPSELREAVLAQHAVISELLDEVESAARRVQGGDGSVLPRLRERGRELHARMAEHLDFEDRFLVPVVRSVDAWGPERAISISEEHGDQRELLAFVLSRLEDREGPVQLLAEQLRNFAGALRDDMHYEEQAIVNENLLRDDVVVIDAASG